MKRALHLLPLFLSLALLAACHKGRAKEKPKAEGLNEPVKPVLPKLSLKEKFGAQPFLELIDAPAKVVLKEGKGEIASNAQTCGACHQEIYKEWQKSTHAYALEDPQFLAELSKESSPRWLCLNCHIPLKNQREYLVNHDTKVLSSGHDLREIERIKNPDFDASLQKEAITCATCHVRKNAEGKGVIVGPRGNTAAPHVVKHDKEALGNICVRCHTPGPVRMTPSFFCWFETDDERKSAGVEETCASCHMQKVQRPLAVGSPSRLSPRHNFAGSPLPKRFEDFGQTPRPTGLEFSTTIETQEGKETLNIKMKNARGGHTITTADPERHLLLDVRIGKGPEQKRFTKRIGQRWDFGDDTRPAKRLEDTRIPFGQERNFSFPLEWTGKVRPEIVTQVLHVRLSASNAKHMKTARFDEEMLRYNPEIEKKVADLEKNYPFFAYIFHETRAESAPSTQRAVRLDQSALTLKSQQARALSLRELKALLDEK